MVSAFKMFVDGSCSTLLKTTASLLPELGPDTAKATTSHIFPEPVPVSRLTTPYLNTKTILPRPGRSDDVRLATLFDLRLGEGLFRKAMEFIFTVHTFPAFLHLRILDKCLASS